MNWAAVITTLQLATATSVVLLAVGLPLAYWIAFSRRKWKILVEAVVALPLVLPPTVLGFYFLVAMGPEGLLGRWYETIAGHALPFTFEGLVAASIIYSLPFAVQPFASAIRSVDRKLIEASWTLGASQFETFFRVILPQSLVGIVTGFVLSFAHTIGEFGVVLMVGGNIPGITRTMSIDIYDHVQALDYSAAGRASVVMLVASFAILTAVYALNRKPWAGWDLH